MEVVEAALVEVLEVVQVMEVALELEVVLVVEEALVVAQGTGEALELEAVSVVVLVDLEEVVELVEEEVEV